MIELIDTNAAGIAAEFVTARTRAGSPAMGMVMTLVIVVDEDDAPTRWGRATASHEHPARVLGVILGDARGDSQIDAQVGTGDGWAGETALIRLTGEVVKHPDSVVLPLLLPDSPVAVWWPCDPPDDPASDPLGRLAQRRITDAAVVSRGKCEAIHHSAGVHAWEHGPGLDPAHPVACAAGGRPRPAPAQGHRWLRDRRADEPQRRPARRVAAQPAQGRHPAQELRGPGITRSSSRPRRDRS